MQTVPQALEDLALQIFREGVLLRQGDSPEGLGYQLRDPEAPLSPFIFDFSRAQESLVREITKELYRKLRTLHWQFGAFAGVPRGGNRFAEALAKGPFEGGKTLVTLEKHPDGTMEVTEPKNLSNTTVVLVEDVLTKGVSIRTAVKALQARNCAVRGTLVIVNREEGGGRTLSKEEIVIEPLLNMTGLIELYWRKDLIGNDEAREMLEYISPIE